MTVKKKIGMKDIAKQLNVSTALVSYVLNDKFTDRINPQTAKRIKELAEELQYHPNQIAKSLKNNKTFTIGLIIADISNLFYSTIARVIEDAAKTHNYNVIFGSADEMLDKFEELVQVFISRQVDGIILAAPEGSEKILKYLQKQSIPFVLIDRDFPDIRDLNSILINNYKASYSVAEHLYENGYKYPAMITLASNLHHLKERSQGFIDASVKLFGEKNIQVIEIEEEDLNERMEPIILELIGKDKKMDAIYFSTNKIALDGLIVLVRNKIKVPETIGLICFDEAYAYNIFNPSVTYVKQPLVEIGEQAVSLLLSRMKGNMLSQRIILDTVIIEGKSSLKKVKNIKANIRTPTTN